jgi:TPP-dependent pyruvate/acetoin dehydrogenase alpha subunit
MTSISAGYTIQTADTGLFSPTANPTTVASDKAGRAPAYGAEANALSLNTLSAENVAATVSTNPSGLLSSGTQSTLLAAQESSTSQPKQQSADPNAYQPTDTEKAFLEYMEKTPAERIREAILKEMGITEEDLAQMTPEQRQGIEEEIAQRMQDKAVKTAEDRENRNV